MNFDDGIQNELSWLILLAVEGKLNKDGFDRMNELLTGSAAARRYYTDILDVHLGMEDVEVQGELGTGDVTAKFNPAVLHALAEYEKVAPSAPRQAAEPDVGLIRKVEREKAVGKINRVSVAVAISSLAAMFFLLAFVYLLPPRRDEPVAHVSRTAGARWAADKGRIETGTQLYPGRMQLLEGAAELVMSNGASVILEAPIEFDLETSSRLYVHRGRLVVSIKHSSEDRFVVRTPFSTIVDFGTEFGVHVDGLMTRTRVYEGQVELRSGSDPLKYASALVLNVDQGGTVNAHGHVDRADIPAHQFIRNEQLRTLELAAGQRYYRWKAFNDQLRRDPALAAHFTFDRPGGPVLANTAPLTGDGFNGILGEYGDRPEWVQGRWPQKTALRFDRDRDQRIRVPAGEKIAITGPITVAAWVYLKEGDQAGHVVSCRAGNHVNYQMSWFGAEHPDRPRRNTIQMLRYHEEPTVRGYSKAAPLQHDQWQLIAATHDNHTARFYLNGELISEAEDVFEAEAVTAELIIAGVPMQGYTQWRFEGMIDEIAILNRTMDGAELKQMFQAGRP